MSETIVREWYFGLFSVVTGIGFAFLYDWIRLYRRFIRHKRWMIDFEDSCYWLICFFISFSLLYYGNYGVIRFFAVIGAGVGMALYCVTLGRVFVPVMYRIFGWFMLPLRVGKNKLTQLSFHFTMKLRERFVKKSGEGDQHVWRTGKKKAFCEKKKACISPKKK